MYTSKRNLIGPKVKSIRCGGKKIITQQDLSVLLALMGIDMDRSAISKIESGRRAVTDYELFAISKALKVTIESLFDDKDEILYCRSARSASK
jgi:HTH-type transcriptional regulator, cell division transcriptional repressor